MNTGTAQPHGVDDNVRFRAWLGSFYIHVILICVLIGTGISYRKLSNADLFRPPSPPIPPVEVILTETVPPPVAPVLPAMPEPSAVPLLPAPVVPATSKKALAKLASHKKDGVTHHHHKHAPTVVPSVPQIPVAKAVPLKFPPKALPLLPPAPVVTAKPVKAPPRALAVVAPPVIAPVGKRQAPPEARAEKAAPVEIPTLPAMPPPRAIAVPIAQPVIAELPPMPPPRALPVPVVAQPAPAPPALPAPPAPPVAAPAPLAAPSAPPQPVSEPFPPPMATPEFALVPGPDRTSFPQPPYPYAAREQGVSGTVVMNVRFDERGAVIYAEVAQSSGQPILDASTKSFIIKKWHLPEYASQSVTVPIIYELNQR